MRAAKSGKQARDDVGENGCCHDLTATNELSRVYWTSLCRTKFRSNAALCREALRRTSIALSSATSYDAAALVASSCALWT